MKLLSLISQNARSLQAHEVMKSLRNCALSGDQDRLQDFVQERVNEHIDYVEDVAKLVKHVAWTDSAQVWSLTQFYSVDVSKSRISE